MGGDLDQVDRFLGELGDARVEPRDLQQVGQQGFEAVELATLEWVDWFNNRRLLEPIGNIPPDEAEAHYYAVLEDQAMAA